MLAEPKAKADNTYDCTKTLIIILRYHKKRILHV